MTVQRRLMHAAAALNVRAYRASGGRLLGQVQGVPVLLLTVAGRQSEIPLGLLTPTS
jgi:F420H(2)-dependent quinone reductase